MLRAAGRRWKRGIDSSAGKTALSHASTSAPGGELVSVSSGLVSAVKHLAFPFGAQTLQCVHRRRRRRLALVGFYRCGAIQQISPAMKVWLTGEWDQKLHRLKRNQTSCEVV